MLLEAGLSFQSTAPRGLPALQTLRLSDRPQEALDVSAKLGLETEGGGPEAFSRLNQHTPRRGHRPFILRCMGPSRLLTGCALGLIVFLTGAEAFPRCLHLPVWLGRVPEGLHLALAHWLTHTVLRPYFLSPPPCVLGKCSNHLHQKATLDMGPGLHCHL